MAVDTSSLLHFTYGGSAPIRLAGYSFQESPEVKEGLGRVGSTVSIELEGEIEGAGSAGYATVVAAVGAALRQSGRDVLITGLGGLTEVSLPAASVRDGGPHVDFKISDGEGATRKVKATIKAKRVGPAGGGVADTYALKIETRPDGLRVVTRSGELHGANGADYYLATVLPAFQAQYPLPTWSVSSDYTSAGGDPGKAKVTYSIDATEHRNPLPTAGAAVAVQGEATERVDRDEQLRKTTVWDYDLVVTGDPVALVSQIRANLSAGGAGQPRRTIYRETVTITRLRETKIRASFTIVESGSGSPLMNWSQSLKVHGRSSTYEEKTYIGADPVAVKRPSRLTRVTQSGSAVCQGRFIRPPRPVFRYLAELPDVTLEHVDDVLQKTSWSYTFLLEPGDGGAFDAAGRLGRPDDLSFYT